MARVGIVTDSTADLALEEYQALGVTMVPLQVLFGDESYLDWVELGPEEFYTKYVYWLNHGGAEALLHYFLYEVDCETFNPAAPAPRSVAKSRMIESNYTDHTAWVNQLMDTPDHVLRINEVPRIDVALVKSSEAPGGIGEPGTSCVMPALTNAIFAATGKRIRKLPVANQASPSVAANVIGAPRWAPA